MHTSTNHMKQDINYFMNQNGNKNSYGSNKAIGLQSIVAFLNFQFNLTAQFLSTCDLQPENKHISKYLSADNIYGGNYKQKDYNQKRLSAKWNYSSTHNQLISHSFWEMKPPRQKLFVKQNNSSTDESGNQPFILGNEANNEAVQKFGNASMKIIYDDET